MEELDYEAAREKLLALGDYQDAAKLAEDCLYLPAISALERIRQGRGPAQADGWQPDGGAEGKRSTTAGATCCSPRRTMTWRRRSSRWRGPFRRLPPGLNCLYEPAIALFQQGEYEKAKEKFDQILAYRDSTILSQESSYRLGLKEQRRQLAGGSRLF